MPKSLENKNYKQRTRFLEANILNLGYAQFDNCTDIGIPIIKSLHTDKQLLDDLGKYKLIGFNFAKTYKAPQIAGVHFFLHDYQFERVWNYPDRYPNMLSKFAYVLSPDFSPYADMPPICQAFNIYRNRWLGAYWQGQGIKVIPTITAGSKELEDIALSGIEYNGIIALSTMGEGRWGNYKGLFNIYDKIIKRIDPTKVILYGKDLRKELKDDNRIIYKQYNNTGE